MKVLLVSGIYPPDIGGPATFIPQLRLALIEKGHTPSVVTLGNRLDIDCKTGIYKIPRGLPIPIRFVVASVLIFFTGLRSHFIYANGLHEEAGIANFFLRKKSIAKVVGDPIWEKARNNRTTTLEILEFNTEKRKPLENLRLKLLVFSLQQFSEIHCPGRELAAILASWSDRLSPEYRPNGVFVSEIDPEETLNREFDLITVSRLVPWKNIDKILASIAGTNLSLAIIGTGPEEHSLRNQASAINNKVSFLGSKNPSEIVELMNSSRIFVQISSYEGQSFSLLQAMSLALPVVISNIPGNTEVVTHDVDGVILENLEIETIKTAFLSISENEELYLRLGAAGRLRIRNEFNLTHQLRSLIFQIESSI